MNVEACFAAICLAQMFAGSFRAYQLSIRRFCDVSEWLVNKSAWIPFAFELPEGSKTNKKNMTSIKKDGR